jgi:hypothetical protein
MSSSAPHSSSVARDRIRFAGVSTPIERRRELGIRGLVPSAYMPLDLDVERCMKQLRSKACSLDQYTYLQSIQDANERLYFAILVKHTAEIMPIVCKCLCSSVACMHACMYLRCCLTDHDIAIIITIPLTVTKNTSRHPHHWSCLRVL